MNKNIKAIGIYGTKLLCKLNPIVLSKILYRIKFKKKLDLKNPKGFNEKLQWLKFYYNNDLIVKCADKFEMHEYVKNNNCEEILNEIYGVYYKEEEIDYSKLPKKFAIKGTHGCGFNIICNDVNKFDIESERKNIKKWLKTDYGLIWGEIHYSKMKPKVIIEKYIEGENGKGPNDYKIYCFNGIPHCTMVCQERKDGIGKAKYYFYDINWRILPYNEESKKGDVNIEKPKGYDKMIDYSKKLSKGFPFVRMDFYDTKKGPILGEMTFTPSAALDSKYIEEVELLFGDMINLK